MIDNVVMIIYDSYDNVTLLNFWLEFMFNIAIKHDDIVVSQTPTV